MNARIYRRGLSLMEALVTLVIIAVISGMVYPRFQKMIARSKQTEAKTILQAVYMGQNAYKTANQVYANDLSLLDISIPEDAKYVYTLEPSKNPNQFSVKAVSNLDDDSVLDEWAIDQTNNLVNRVNDVIE